MSDIMMKTAQEALKYVKSAFQTAQISEASQQAEILLCDLLSCSRSDLHSKQLTDNDWNLCLFRMAERIRGVPLQYIQGQVEFYHCIIQVSPAVLIPRQETEILVDKIVQKLSKMDLKGKVLWDVCCGSGCIGIALKKQFPDLKVILSDLSEEALKVAKANAKANEVDVEFLQGDLLSPYKGLKADFFVCNPPYISRLAYEKLDKEVKEHEPQGALLAGEEGSEFYQRLATELPNYLNLGAEVWFEIGYDQGELLLQLFKGAPWQNPSIEKDWSGHDRFFYISF